MPEKTEEQELAEMAIAWLKDIGIENDAVTTTAVAYMIADGVDNIFDLTSDEMKEYFDRAAYNSNLAKKWLHAEKLTPH